MRFDLLSFLLGAFLQFYGEFWPGLVDWPWLLDFEFVDCLKITAGFPPEIKNCQKERNVSSDIFP
jgi:hypothetical protein